jgi:iron complex outermembrane receptor protein
MHSGEKRDPDVTALPSIETRDSVMRQRYPDTNLLVAALLGAFISMPAFGQLEEITVTARKVEESLQTAPISVTAFTERVIETAGIRNLADLATLTPNLTFEAGETGRRQTPVIRGLGVIDSRGFDNNVGVFLDGVFMSGRTSQNMEIFDVERVEIVRGPQGALYGRNSFAGAINYVTKKPSPEFGAKFEATAADDDMYEVRGSVSGPMGKNVAGRIAFLYADDDGMYRNGGPSKSGRGIGGFEHKALAGDMRFTPNDDIDINLRGWISSDTLDNRPLSKLANNCGELDPDKFPRTLSSYDQGAPAYYCGNVPPSESRTISMSPQAYSADGDTWRLMLDAEFNLNWATLTSITAYTDNNNKARADLDRTQAGEDFYGYVELAAYEAIGSPPVIGSLETAFPDNSGVTAMNTLIGSVGLNQEYFSQELRLNSAGDQRFRWLAGLYYFHNENKDTTDLGIDASAAVADLGLPTSELRFLLVSPGTGPNGTTLAVPNPVLPNVAFFDNPNQVAELIVATTEADQYAAFGSMEFDFTDRLTGTAELRYTYEERKLNNEKDIFFFTPVSEFDDDWDFWDPRFILRYQATDDFMVYGSVAKGSRSGGLNVAVAEPAAVPFDEETNWTSELGFKSSWFDQRLQFNLSAFYIDWDDAQFRQRVPAQDSILTVTTNATGLKNRGFEAELVAAPFDTLTVGATFGYADPEYDNGTIASGDRTLCDFKDAGDTAFPLAQVKCVPVDSDGDGVFDDEAPDISGKRPIRTAKRTASFFAEAVRPIGPDLDVLFRFDVGYRSKMNTDNVSIQYAPSRTIANLHLGVTNDKFDLFFWVRNLSNEDSVETSQIFASDLNSSRFVTTAVNINPRRWGVTARYRLGSAR